MAITGEGTFQNFAYTGGMQSLVVPFDGLYKLEAWGAGGNGSNVAASKGGYSVGYKEFKKNTTIYICVGGSGQSHNGYNGGGTGPGWANPEEGTEGRGGTGGGATHMALVTGLLYNVGYTQFVTNKKGLIVAGGAGGNGGRRGWSDSGEYRDDEHSGGTGGGTSGGNGAGGSNIGYGGSQTGGGGGISGGSFGKGANASEAGGGGGGFYGGGSGYYGAAGGGSGWIGGVPQITYKGTKYTPSTSNGQQAGDGYARITFVKKGFPAIKWNGTTLDALKFNGVNIDTVIFNGTTLT